VLKSKIPLDKKISKIVEGDEDEDEDDE
jgi:hypothetical protein